METVVWSEEFSVDIKEIDAQHKYFIRFLKEAYAKMDQMLKPGELHPLLDRLSEHADEHFATEEKYFNKFNYKYGPFHTKLHNEIKEEIVEFKKRHKSDASSGIAIELVDFLEEWLLVHILKHDKQYMDVFHEHGLH